MRILDIAIIGGGPAGIAAALQLGRMGFVPTVFEGGRTGGLLLNANLVENYPGLNQPVSGLKLAGRLENQLARSGAEVINARVTELDYRDDRFYLRTADNTYTSRTVLLATGTKARRIGAPAIPEKARHLVFSEIYTILESAGKDIAIVGAGDAALDYALNLARLNRVTILNKSSRTKCLRLLFERAMAHERITYRDNCKIESIDIESSERLLLKLGPETMTCDYLVTAVGREPNLDLLSVNLKAQMQKLQDKKILYLAGDVKNGIYRQASIAAGEGIREAMKIAHFLQGRLS